MIANSKAGRRECASESRSRARELHSDREPRCTEWPLRHGFHGVELSSDVLRYDHHGGVWTRVSYPEFLDEEARAILGDSGRQLLKCAESGTAFIESPSITTWSWTPGYFVQAPGVWVVSGLNQECLADREYTDISCSTLFGVGCGSGPGPRTNYSPV